MWQDNELSKSHKVWQLLKLRKPFFWVDLFYSSSVDQTKQSRHSLLKSHKKTETVRKQAPEQSFAHQTLDSSVPESVGHRILLASFQKSNQK